MHIIVCGRKTLSTEVETENTVDAACQTARIVPVRRQAESAFLDDRTAVPIVRPGESGGVHRCHIESEKLRLDLALLRRVENHDLRRQLREHSLHIFAVAIR